MTTRRMLLATATGLGVSAAFAWRHPAAALSTPRLQLTQAQWRARLTPGQFKILRQAGTEMPFSSPLDMNFKPGRYDCVGCGQKLYSSKTKFDSHTGWPSFYEPLPDAVQRSADGSLGMERTEVHCVNCAGHLGHVFDDGPKPTGLRYCMNGVALQFIPGDVA